MRESSILKRITDTLQRRRREGVPLWWVKVHGGPMQRAGVPDLLVCYGGRFLAVEVKVPGGRATRLQAETMGRIREAAGWTIVATSPEDVTAWLDHVRADGYGDCPRPHARPRRVEHAGRRTGGDGMIDQQRWRRWNDRPTTA